MNREVKFDKNAICDNCGAIGAFDFMGDYLCEKCAESNKSNRQVERMLGVDVVIVQDPEDWTMIRIPIDGYEVGTKHKITAVRGDNVYFDGCIHPFHKDDVCT